MHKAAKGKVALAERFHGFSLVFLGKPTLPRDWSPLPQSLLPSVPCLPRACLFHREAAKVSSAIPISSQGMQKHVKGQALGWAVESLRSLRSPALASTPGLHQTWTVTPAMPADNSPRAARFLSEAYQPGSRSLMPSTGEVLKSQLLPFSACALMPCSILPSPWFPWHSFPEYHFFPFLQQHKSSTWVYSVSLTFCFPRLAGSNATCKKCKSQLCWAQFLLPLSKFLALLDSPVQFCAGGQSSIGPGRICWMG